MVDLVLSQQSLLHSKLLNDFYCLHTSGSSSRWNFLFLFYNFPTSALLDSNLLLIEWQMSLDSFEKDNLKKKWWSKMLCLNIRTNLWKIKLKQTQGSTQVQYYSLNYRNCKLRTTKRIIKYNLFLKSYCCLKVNWKKVRNFWSKLKTKFHNFRKYSKNMKVQRTKTWNLKRKWPITSRKLKKW